MANLYLVEQGAVLRKTGARVVVTKKQDVLLEVPCHAIEAVLMFGNVHFTTPALRTLFEHDIELALFSLGGKLICQLTPPVSKNVELRLAQYDRARDPSVSLALARGFVEAKVANGVELMRQHEYNHPESGLAEAIAAADGWRQRAAVASSREELFGVEGSAARAYFEGFARMLRGELGFPGRQRRPPRDPVNALLSLGYTLLHNEIASLLDGIGFDPHLGFFHQPHYGRASLAADLVEEFRAAVVDRLTLRLFNTRIFGREDFEDGGGSMGTRLTPAAFRRYFVEYEGHLGEPTSAVSDEAGEQVVGAADAGRRSPTLRERIRRQTYRLERSVLAGEEYQAFRLAESSTTSRGG